MALCILFLWQRAHSWSKSLTSQANALRRGAERREAQPHLVNLELQSLCLLIGQLLDLWPGGLCLGLLGQPGCPLCLLPAFSLLPSSLLSPALLCQLVVVVKSLCDELRRAAKHQSRGQWPPLPHTSCQVQQLRKGGDSAWSNFVTSRTQAQPLQEAFHEHPGDTSRPQLALFLPLSILGT